MRLLFLSVLYFLKGKSLHTTHTKVWGIRVHLLLHAGGQYVHTLFGVLLVRFVPPHFFIYSTLYLWSMWTCGYLFYTLGYNPILHYFAAQIVPSWVLGRAFSRFLCPLVTYLHHCGFFFLIFFFEHLIFLSGTMNAPGSLCIFVAPALESTISPRNTDSFYWKVVLETTFWHQVSSLLLGCHCFSVLSDRAREEMYGY